MFVLKLVHGQNNGTSSTDDSYDLDIDMQFYHAKADLWTAEFFIFITVCVAILACFCFCCCCIYSISSILTKDSLLRSSKRRSTWGRQSAADEAPIDVKAVNKNKKRKETEIIEYQSDNEVVSGDRRFVSRDDTTDTLSGLYRGSTSSAPRTKGESLGFSEDARNRHSTIATPRGLYKSENSMEIGLRPSELEIP